MCGFTAQGNLLLSSLQQAAPAPPPPGYVKGQMGWEEVYSTIKVIQSVVKPGGCQIFRARTAIRSCNWQLGGQPGFARPGIAQINSMVGC